MATVNYLVTNILQNIVLNRKRGLIHDDRIFFSFYAELSLKSTDKRESVKKVWELTISEVFVSHNAK